MAGGKGASSLAVNYTSRGFVRIRMVSANKKVELVQTIGGAGGQTVPVDRRPKLNERLAHRIVARQPSETFTPDRSTMTEIVSIHAREILDSRGNPTVEADVTL